VEGVLVLKVKGKYDDTPHYLSTLWADDECPDLCVVQLLFAYLFLTGSIKGGYLFPDDVGVVATSG
jgi:hypothetical protein